MIPRQRMISDDFGGAVRAESHERRRIGVTGEMAHERQRGPIRPMEVVEHEQHRCALGHAAQQRVDGLEHQVALGVGLGPGGLGQIGEPQTDVGDKPRQDRAASHEIGAHPGRVTVTEVLLDRLDERLVRDDVLFVAASEQHAAPK